MKSVWRSHCPTTLCFIKLLRRPRRTKSGIDLENLACHLKAEQVRSLLGNLAVLLLYHLHHLPIVQKIVEDHVAAVGGRLLLQESK
ncbi:hypothetical protein AVEN_30841-1 [Araneus ventricosus]|uniref:Uncharacterized protein n=1 Tax=Araneus ventricosus TaxID=182803 RepID=A0A4Y2QYV0_ARAVE|nr:hypothetical protein AVEN_30841-1 [Araneus ventricosus]